MKEIYQYWLCSIPGIGNDTIARLLECFGTAEAIFAAPAKQLSGVLKKNQLAELERTRGEWELQGKYDELAKKGIRFLTRDGDFYPARLKNIPDAPYGIFYKGSLPKDECLSVAIIGARDCSEYGRYIAKELGGFLGRNGVQVISGMARGIDGIGQQAALMAGGTTTAVLGCGVDICYPKQNRVLYEKILEQGCILSTYPPGTLPKSGNFPPRNRIVSGLADAVVVIEARNQSGTLITVDMALEQGKEVYVVPGRITDRLSDGCNRLLKQGAGVLLSPADFLEEIRGMELRKTERGDVRSASVVKMRSVDLAGKSCFGEVKQELSEGLPEDLQEIYRLLDFSPKSTGQILEQLTEGISISELNVALMKLCLLGMAVQELPGYFALHISSKPL